MANEVKWIKIVTDIFNDEKMYAIETLPDGFTMELVWFKILCLAGKCNQNGYLCVSTKIAYTDEMLAKIFRMEIGIVQRALNLFQELEMIEVVDNAYMVSNWLLYQSGDRLDEIKEQTRLRQQRFREKQKQIGSNVTCNVTDNVINNVTSSISISNSIKDIIDYLNTKLNKHFTYKNKNYNAKITARLNEGFTVDDFKTVIDKKYDEWIGTDMAKYLDPDTLFASSKFEKYLNQSEVKSHGQRSDESVVSDLYKGISFDLSKGLG